MSDIPLPADEAQRLRFEAEWARLGRAWWHLIELSPQLGRIARECLNDMQELVRQAEESLQGLRSTGLQPPKGTS